jgi:hypothetical protein
MPRNEIAAIIGLIVVVLAVFAGPPSVRGAPRTAQGIGTLVAIFVIAFAIVCIALRLINY